MNSDLVEKDIELNLNGNIIRGVFTLPKSFSEATITVHGWAGNRIGPQRMFVHLARKLYQKNIATLRFDLPGRGFSDPLSQKTSLDQMIDSVVAVAEYLKSEYCIEKINIVGICSGGNVALGALPLLKTIKVNAVCISTLPFQTPSTEMKLRKTTEVAKTYLKKALSLNAWKRVIARDIDYSGINKTFTSAMTTGSKEEILLKTSARDIIKELQGDAHKIMFIYGGKDSQSEIAYSYFCKSLGKIITVIIADADHNFYSIRMMNKLQKTIVDYLVDLGCA